MPILDKTNKVMIAKYNEFVRGREHSSLTQDYSYLCSDKSKQFEIVYLEQNDNIIAAMAVVIVPINNKQTMLYSFKGPVSDIYDIKLVNRLIDELKEIANKYNSIYFVMNPEVVKDEKLIALYKKNKYKIKAVKNVCMQVELKNKTIEEVFCGFLDKTKYNIDAAEKKEIKLKIGTTKRDFETFMNLYKAEHEVKIQDIKNFEMFKELLNSFDSDVIRIYTASYKRKNISSAIICKYGDKVKCIEEAWTNTADGIYARSKLHYEAIKWAKSNECDFYDFDELDNASGLDYRFKEGFATKDGVIEYIVDIYKVFNIPAYTIYKFFRR